jgi:hypothetical protein
MEAVIFTLIGKRNGHTQLRGLFLSRPNFSHSIYER